MHADFRQASEADAQQILAFMAALYGEDESTPFSLERATTAVRRLLGHPELGQVWLLEVSQRPAGYLVLTWGYSLEFHGPDAFIDELYVAPDYRGAGLGRLAIELAERQCRDRGIGALHLEVEPGNERAQSLYRRSGFEGRGYHLLTKRLER